MATPGIAELFANIDAQIATHRDPRGFLRSQIETWETRVTQLRAWAKGARAERPCNGELDASDMAEILLGLNKRLAGLTKRAA